jgi:hypothetical protein
MDRNSQLFKEIEKMLSDNKFKKIYKIQIHRVEVNYMPNPYNVSINRILHFTDKHISDVISCLKEAYPDYNIYFENDILYIDTLRKYEYDNSPITKKDLINARKLYDEHMRDEEEKAVDEIMRIFIDIIDVTLVKHPHRSGVCVRFIKTPSDHVFLKNKNERVKRYNAGVFKILTERLIEKYPDFKVIIYDEGDNTRIITTVFLVWDDDITTPIFDVSKYTTKDYSNERLIDNIL